METAGVAVEHPNAGFGGAECVTEESVLYVSPLRMIVPSGSEGGVSAPPPQQQQGEEASNGPDVEALKKSLEQATGVKKCKPSAVRDYPEGVGRNARKVDSELVEDLAKTPQGNLNDGSSKGASAEIVSPKPRRPKKGGDKNIPPEAVDEVEEPASSPETTPVKRRNSKVTPPSRAKSAQAENKARPAKALSSPDVTPKNNKRRDSKPPTPSDAKKVRRSAGKASKRASSNLGEVDSGDPRKAVKNTMMLYDAVRRNLLQLEELKRKEGGKGRADLNAGAAINAKGLSVNRNSKIVGSVPGVEIGDQFYFRTELNCIGMHGPIQSGIDYLTSKESEWDTPVAISIISSGGYDDIDDGEQLIYTGQGGKSAVANKANEDQKLERGNLGMDGSMKHGVPVRVIRGIKDPTSHSGKIYTYDGLYKVQTSWTEKGKGGYEEFKFRLEREPGQPELGSALIKLGNQLKHKPSPRDGLLVDDISKGKENSAVCVVNTVDNEACPTTFEYSTKIQYPDGFDQLELASGCECKGSCGISERCLCFSKNGNEFAYLSSGVLVKEKDVIYECGSQCKCPPTCRNRITQKGLKYRLEIFKTENRGWGVRSWDSIPAGSFICEYTGKAIDDMGMLENMDDNEYLLDVKRVSRNKILWGDVSDILENQTSDTSSEMLARPDLVLDASEIGNVARFINHCCSPNLFAQCVLYDHHDTQFPHIMLFALENISPFRELTLDYGPVESEEASTNSHMRSKDCLCGVLDCRGKFYY
eukprot:c29219_g1_i1 orf=338-2611(+)